MLRGRIWRCRLDWGEVVETLGGVFEFLGVLLVLLWSWLKL